MHFRSDRNTSVSRSKELAGARFSLAQHCAAVPVDRAARCGRRGPEGTQPKSSPRDGSCARELVVPSGTPPMDHPSVGYLFDGLEYSRKGLLTPVISDIQVLVPLLTGPRHCGALVLSSSRGPPVGAAAAALAAATAAGRAARPPNKGSSKAKGRQARSICSRVLSVPRSLVRSR